MTGPAERARRLAAEAARAAVRPESARALLLDLDGTLAPLVDRPERAEVPPAALDAMRELAARGWRLAVVSGRPAVQVRRMVPMPHIRVFGSHGLEGSWRGRSTVHSVPLPLRRRLGRLERRGREAARGIPGVLVESKPAGVAFHDRRVPPEHLQAWRRRLKDLLRHANLQGLEVLRGHRVIEVRPEGFSKALAVKSLPGADAIRRMDPSFLALGDDRTDEDMFRAIRGKGLGVLVGSGRWRTAARRRLASPRQVLRFLSFLAESRR